MHDKHQGHPARQHEAATSASWQQEGIFRVKQCRTVSVKEDFHPGGIPS